MKVGVKVMSDAQHFNAASLTPVLSKTYRNLGSKRKQYTHKLLTKSCRGNSDVKMHLF